MANFKLEGIVRHVGQTQEVSDKFKKRELVVVDESDSNYPQILPFEFTQDKTSLLDNIMEGQTVEVSFSLRGREWTNANGDTKVFSSMNGFRVDVLSGGTKKSATKKVVEEEDESLPF